MEDLPERRLIGEDDGAALFPDPFAGIGKREEVDSRADVNAVGAVQTAVEVQGVFRHIIAVILQLEVVRGIAGVADILVRDQFAVRQEDGAQLWQGNLSKR